MRTLTGDGLQKKNSVKDPWVFDVAARGVSRGGDKSDKGISRDSGCASLYQTMSLVRCSVKNGGKHEGYLWAYMYRARCYFYMHKVFNS